jgi:hypothetical protein
VGLLVGLVLGDFGMHLLRVVVERDYWTHFWTSLFHEIHFRVEHISFFHQENVRVKEGVKWQEKVWQATRKWRSEGHEKEDSENVRDLGSVRGRKHVKEKEWKWKRNGDRESESESEIVTICFYGDVGFRV